MLTGARNAVYIAFVANGFTFASWASRIPQVRDRLQLEPAQLGLLLLCVAVGSLIAMPLSGVVVTRLGASRAVAVFSVVAGAGMSIVAVGYQLGIPVVVGGLFLMGLGVGTWDVAMNVEGAAVEQRLGKAIMPRFHAGFSVGTVAGALGGTAMVALDVSVTWHLIAVALLTVVLVPLGARRFLPREPAAEPGGHLVEPAAPRHPLKAWTEPRTLLIGVFVLCMAFTEGTGNDWLAIAMIDGYAAKPALGPLTFAVFLAAMTAGRWFGPGLLDRHGRVGTVRVSAVIALVGLLLVVFGHWLPVAMVGAAFWGVGTALGFPVGMSAAADDQRYAAARVSVVASIGYTAFLGGPPLIGFLGQHFGVLHGLTAVAGVLAIAAMLAGNTREPPAP